MRYLLNCRRTYTATLGILCCTALGAYLKIDVSLAILGVVSSIAGANASEAIFKKLKGDV